VCERERERKRERKKGREKAKRKKTCANSRLSDGPREGAAASGITSCTDPDRPDRIGGLYHALHEAGIITSFRHDRAGRPHLRFSPHCYNTHAELERVFEVIRRAGT